MMKPSAKLAQFFSSLFWSWYNHFNLVWNLHDSSYQTILIFDFCLPKWREKECVSWFSASVSFLFVPWKNLAAKDETCEYSSNHPPSINFSHKSHPCIYYPLWLYSETGSSIDLYLDVEFFFHLYKILSPSTDMNNCWKNENFHEILFLHVQSFSFSFHLWKKGGKVYGSKKDEQR